MIALVAGKWGKRSLGWRKVTCWAEGRIARCWPNMSVYKWKGSGLESHSLQSREPMAVAEGSQMCRPCVCVTGLAVLARSHCCKSFLTQLLLVLPQGRTAQGQPLGTVTLSPGLFFLPRGVTHTYCDPPCCFSLLYPPASPRVSQYQKVFLNTRSTRGITGRRFLAVFYSVLLEKD